MSATESSEGGAVEVLSSKEEEAKLTALVAQTKLILTEIKTVSEVIKLVLTQSLSGEGEEVNIAILLTKIIIITTKISENAFDDDELTEALSFVKEVTKVSSISTVEEETLIEIQSLLAMFTVTLSGSLSGASQGLIANKGLVVAEIDSTLSFDEQAEKAEQQLSTNRANCEGMDKAAQSLNTLLKSDSTKFVCQDQFDDDCDDASDDTKSLLDATVELTELSNNNIEDEQISVAASSIISSLTSITIITFEQKSILFSLIATIKSTVLIYISQISLVESNKLKIGGALAFPGAETTIDKIDEANFALKITVLEAQITNLFQISNANDKVLECIGKIEGLDAANDPSENAALKENVEKVPAMCSQPEPPVEEVQKTAVDITSTCSSLTEAPTEAEIKVLLFIKKSLITFKQTFTSQLTIFTQQLSSVTGVSITASSLSVTIISSSGFLGVAEEVDITGGLTVNSVEFFVARYELMKSTLFSLELVFNKLNTVLSITEDGAQVENSKSPADFALLLLEFSAQLSSGSITSDILVISKSILQSQVTAAPSGSILILFNSISLTLSSLQLTLLSEIVSIKQQLVIALVASGQSLSDLTFVIKSFDESGEAIEISEAGGDSADASSTELASSLETLQLSQTMFSSIMIYLTASINFEYTTLELSPSVEISLVKFVQEILLFTLTLGKNPTDPEIITIGQRLLTYQLSFAASPAVITQLQFIFSTVQIFSIQLVTEQIGIQSRLNAIKVQDVSCSLDSLDDDKEQISNLKSFKDMFGKLSTAFGTASSSTETEAENSALQFFDHTVNFYLLFSGFQIYPIGLDKMDTFEDLIKRIIYESETGVGPSPGKFKNIYESVTKSLDLISTDIQAQVDALDCVNIIAEYQRLKSNQFAVQQIISTIDLLQKNTNFSAIPPPTTCSPPGLPLPGAGFEIPACKPADGDGGMKSVDILLTLFDGLTTSLSSSVSETSIVPMVETINDALFKHEFESSTADQNSKLDTIVSTLSSFTSNFEAEISKVTEKLEEKNINVAEIKFYEILFPPCPPAPIDPLEQLTLQLSGLISNLNALESTQQAIETVISGPADTPVTSVDDFVASLNALDALLTLFNPCELHLLIIQEISALLVSFSIQIQQATSVQITFLNQFLIIVQQFILTIMSQITLIQNYFIEFTGSIPGPVEDIVPQLPSELEADLQKEITIMNSLLIKLEFIIIFILKIINVDASIIVSTSQYTCTDLFGLLMKFLSLLIKGQFGQPLLDAADAILQITSISAACGTQILGFIQIIFTILGEQNINIISTIVTLTQTLIVSKGFILKFSFVEIAQLSFAEQKTAFEASLETSRQNCEGMDRVGLAIEAFLLDIEVCETEEDNAQITTLITDLTFLTKLAAANLENSTIFTKSESILTFITTLTDVQCISSNQLKVVQKLILTIQNTVLIFVTQISILEQRKLLLGGGLQFSFSISAEGVEVENFAKLTDINIAQLTGLMQCGDFTDRSRLSISAATGPGVSTGPDNDCDGGEVVRSARRVTAMCSAPVLPIEDVAQSTRDLARCSSSLTSRPSLRDVSQLDFIVISLNTFRITFTSQITIVQQKLAFLSGQSLSAASLNINFINEFGLDIPAPEIDITGGDTNLIPVPGLEIDPNSEDKLGYELFLVKQWTEYRFAYSTLQIVMTCITTVLDVRGFNIGGGSGAAVDGRDFFTAVNTYFTKIGQGLFLIDELYTITGDIIKLAYDVTIEVSNSIVLLLQSIMVSLTSYQMACLSEFIIIQQKLIQIGFQISFREMLIIHNSFSFCFHFIFGD